MNFEKFEYDKHFDSEGEFVGLKTLILGILKLPILIINRLLIKYISIKRYEKIDKILFDRANDKKDLTFGDLILSKLNGKFSLREDCKIELVK